MDTMSLQSLPSATYQFPRNPDPLDVLLQATVRVSRMGDSTTYLVPLQSLRPIENFFSDLSYLFPNPSQPRVFFMYPRHTSPRDRLLEISPTHWEPLAPLLANCHLWVVYPTDVPSPTDGDEQQLFNLVHPTRKTHITFALSPNLAFWHLSDAIDPRPVHSRAQLTACLEELCLTHDMRGTFDPKKLAQTCAMEVSNWLAKAAAKAAEDMESAFEGLYVFSGDVKVTKREERKDDMMCEIFREERQNEMVCEILGVRKI